jgi:hypothetical protein
MFKTLVIATTIAALSLMTMQFAGAQTSQKPTKTSTAYSQVKKNYYGRDMQAHWGAGCKMSGSC